jgi:peptidyl-prolyl cis-trans isomerase A (cyclophilin A)
MRARFAVLVVLGAAFAGGCRRAEAPAPSPSPTTAVATPTPSPRPVILDPSRATERAPDRFRVRFETTRGPFVVEVTRAWAPAADRFYNLVRAGYYDDVALLPRDRELHGPVRDQRATGSTLRGGGPHPRRPGAVEPAGMVTYAMAGGHADHPALPSTRTTRASTARGSPLRWPWSGTAVVDSLYSGYGEGAPRGRGPDQGRAQAEGNAYLRGSFPRMDFVKTARVVKP